MTFEIALLLSLAIVGVGFLSHSWKIRLLQAQRNSLEGSLRLANFRIDSLRDDLRYVVKRFELTHPDAGGIPLSDEAEAELDAFAEKLNDAAPQQGKDEG